MTNPVPQPALRGKVLRSFYYQGAPLRVEAVVDLPRVFALEMVAAKKFELLPEAPPVDAPAADESPADAPATTDDKAAARRRR